MAVLRQELVDSFWKLKMREYVSKEMATRKEAREKVEKEKAEQEDGSKEDVGCHLVMRPGEVLI
jgi:protein TIF31